MRLLVDATFLRPGRVGGAEFMLYALLEAIASTCEDEDAVAVMLPRGVDLQGAGPGKLQAVEIIETKIRLNRFVSSELISLEGFDAVLFTNYYTPLRTVARGTITTVTVIHDLQFRTYPKNFSLAKRLFQSVAIRTTCKLADRVIAISEFTANEIVGYQPKAARKLVTIQNPILWSRFDSSKRPKIGAELAGRTFFLVAAAQYPHKNIPTVIRAFDSLVASFPEVHLVVVGQVPSNLVGSRPTPRLKIGQNVHELGYVSNSELTWLYKNCLALLVPSLYEGCGLPCAEVLGLGGNVIHSGYGALREVAQGFGVMVQYPMEPASWERAMSDQAVAGRSATRLEEIKAVRGRHDPEAVGRQYWNALKNDYVV